MDKCTNDNLWIPLENFCLGRCYTLLKVSIARQPGFPSDEMKLKTGNVKKKKVQNSIAINPTEL